MNDIKISRTLYKNSRISIDFFSYFPKVTKKANDNFSVSYNPVMYIRYLTYGNTGKDPSLSYKVTPRNLYRVIRFFNTIVEWFHDPKMNDLFLLNDDNTPIFNADYNKLNVSTGRKQFEDGIMRAIPSVIEFNNNKFEGIYLYINKLDHQIPLLYSEIDLIFGIISTIRFSEELQMCMSAYNYALSTNSFLTDNPRWTNTPINNTTDTKTTPFNK